MAQKSSGLPKRFKRFDGAQLSPLPSLQEFESACGGSKGVSILLGEEFNYEQQKFFIDWEQEEGQNLCIAGADEDIRKGLLHALLLSVSGHFERIVYFNTTRHGEHLSLSVANLEIKPYDWNGDMADIIADFQQKKTLVIIDPLESAKVFRLAETDYGKPKEGSPAFLLKQFLGDAPPCGSHTVVFVKSWQQFKKQFNYCVDSLGLRIGFQLNAEDARDLTRTTQFKGLDNTKAVFANLQRDEQVLFRPYVVPTGE